MSEARQSVRCIKEQPQAIGPDELLQECMPGFFFALRDQVGGVCLCVHANGI